MHVWFIRIFRM